MRSQTQGLLANLLMFLPLLAVPFVASFGVPWLSAKVKDEGISVPELADPVPFGPGVGQSSTATHSPDDLFAPITTEAVVDLKLASPPASAQNPHLRNASLVVTQSNAWVDPFENLDASMPEAPPAQAPPAARQAVNPTEISPQQALAGWEVKEEAGDFGPPESPMPGEFPAGPPEEPPATSANPFAAFETASSPGTEVAEVEVKETAFEDPVFEPNVNRDPQKFDASRTLFNQSESPAAPKRTVESEPPASSFPNVGTDLKNAGQKSAEPLTWESARSRLQELGITDYYLQPDAEANVFLFRCAYTPADNPRINHLFEAEAAEPLEAVRKVLSQLETWTSTQSASAN